MAGVVANLVRDAEIFPTFLADILVVDDDLVLLPVLFSNSKLSFGAETMRRSAEDLGYIPPRGKAPSLCESCPHVLTRCQYYRMDCPAFWTVL